MFHITPQRPEDGPAIEFLLDRAFGAHRHQLTSYRYRDGVAPVRGLNLVAREHRKIVGTIRYWPVWIAPHSDMNERDRALLLGPVAVEPERQGEGIGVELIRSSLRKATTAGHSIVMLVGDEAYYGRFGFSPAAARGVEMPGEPDRLLIRELVPGALARVSGTVQAWGCLRSGWMNGRVSAPSVPFPPVADNPLNQQDRPILP